MVFSSLVFILFLFAFLVVQNFCSDIRKKNTAMLVFSLIYLMWGGIAYLLITVILTAVAWYDGKIIGAARSTADKRTKLILGLVVSVGALLGFHISRLLTGPSADSFTRYVLPMGMYYYTLQSVSYLIDIFDGKVQAQSSFSIYLTYNCMFPRMCYGPVVRYGAIRKELFARKMRSGDFSKGIMRFSCGLAKKCVLANSCLIFANSLTGTDSASIAQAKVLSVWVAAVFFMLFIYLELSSYADMAIGIGLMSGFHFPENFSYPYLADTLGNFWQSWNLTVVDFFRSYIYEPLFGGRNAKNISIVGLCVTWMLFAIWQGRTWNCIIWGAFMLIMLLVEKFALHDLEKFNPVLKHVWVLGIAFVGFIMYRFGTPGELLVALKGMIGLNHAGICDIELAIELVRHLPLFLIAVIAVTPLTTIAGNALKHEATVNQSFLKGMAIWNAICPVLLILISVMAMIGSGVPSLFLFQS